MDSEVLTPFDPRGVPDLYLPCPYHPKASTLPAAVPVGSKRCEHLFRPAYHLTGGSLPLVRHFHVESNLINFVARNAGGTGIEEANNNKPNGPQDLGDVDGVNATILHDANMFNFIVDIGHAEGANLTEQIPLEKIDFSALEFPEPEVETHGRFLNLDFESTLYLIVAFMTTFLPEDTAESAANSLELDESLCISLRTIPEMTGLEIGRP